MMFPQLLSRRPSPRSVDVLLRTVRKLALRGAAPPSAALGILEGLAPRVTESLSRGACPVCERVFGNGQGLVTHTVVTGRCARAIRDLVLVAALAYDEYRSSYAKSGGGIVVVGRRFSNIYEAARFFAGEFRQRYKFQCPF